MKEKTKNILIAIVILVCVYVFIIEPALTRAHCKEIAREDARVEARVNCRYGDVDCIIDYYEYFYKISFA